MHFLASNDAKVIFWHFLCNCFAPHCQRPILNAPKVPSGMFLNSEIKSPIALFKRGHPLSSLLELHKGLILDLLIGRSVLQRKEATTNIGISNDGVVTASKWESAQQLFKDLAWPFLNSPVFSTFYGNLVLFSISSLGFSLVGNLAFSTLSSPSTLIQDVI